MLTRQAAPHLLDLARWYPVLAVTGPRQSGKTTLVRTLFSAKPYVSLEDPDVRHSAQQDPRGFLALYPEGAVLDEAQHVPELFSYLQTRVDDDKLKGRKGSLWVVTGSQHFGLIAPITQSLAGRVGLLHLLPLSLGELQAAGHPAATQGLAELLWRGLYPALLEHDLPPAVWLADYVATYVERDLRQLLNVRDLTPFRTFLRMCAARCAQTVNLSALAADCGITANTARAWLSILEASYIVYTLPQHHVNLGKRLTKSPKLYFYDSGLAAWLAGLRSADEVAHSALRGPLFETWALGEVLKTRSNLHLQPSLHYWRDKAGLEVDLLIDHGPHLTPIEFKAGQTVAGDWAANLQRYGQYFRNSQALRAAPSLGEASIVYGGSEARLCSGVPVIPWRAWPARAQAAMGSDRGGEMSAPAT